MMKKSAAPLFFIGVLLSLSLYAQQDNLEDWHYIEIDSTKQMWGDWYDPDWLRYFGLDAGDVDRDGNLDIVSGRYIYHNPGGTMEDEWQRTVLDDNVDGILFMDVDGDPYADIIAMALPGLYWYEATNAEGTRYRRKKIGEVPATSHVNSQGFERAQILPGGMEEILIAGNGDIYALEIPKDNPDTENWKVQMIAKNTSDEGIGVGDIDGDGDLDIAAGRRPEGEEEPKILVWYENPSSIDKLWKPTVVGESEHPIDRVGITDIDGDQKADIVVTEERYPGEEPDANFWWFKQGTDSWTRNKIVTQYSINNLDITDFDKDGDSDLLTAEHKGEALELQLWKNDGKGNFSKSVLDTSKENHLGTQFFDLDNDGDLDIIGAGWDNHKYMHVWRNDALQEGRNELKTLKTPLHDGEMVHGMDVQWPGIMLNIKRVGSPEKSVEIAEGTYEKRPHYIVSTQAATYYYDKAGGGFSRIIDAYGNDWISYRTEPWNQYPTSAASSYRGLPNLVFGSDTDGGAGHPGHDRAVSEVVSTNKIKTVSKSGNWEWDWTFHEDHAVLNILKTEDDATYWFLYEGTPGGSYAPTESGYGTNATGYKKDVPDFYKGEIVYGNFDWAYFSKQGVDTSFYLAQATPDGHMDMMSYLGDSDKGAESENGMTVFGFGRGKDTKALLKGKNTFIIGIAGFAVEDEIGHKKMENMLNETVSEYENQ